MQSPCPRPYLRAADRRRHLLDAATGLAGREGLDRLSMAGLAAAAGVSRQLVYAHFPDRPALVQAVLIDRFSALDGAIASELAAAEPSAEPSARSVLRRILSLPPEDRRIIRSLLVRAGTPEDDLAELAVAIRDRAIARWSAFLQMPAVAGSRAVLWALTSAVFSLGDFVDDGTITIDEAVAHIERLADGATPPLH